MRLAGALGVTVDDLMRPSDEEAPEPAIAQTPSA